MSTAITLGGADIADDIADAFFARIAELEGLLSRFRPHSQLARFSREEVAGDDLDPAIREVLHACESLRMLTDGDFEHEPRNRSGDPADVVLDVNAYAKGWIIEEAATLVRMAAGGFFVNAGGDVLLTTRLDRTPWRVGVQHPDDRAAVLGTFEIDAGAVATSGAYERGPHIRSSAGAALTSVTVAGPDLALADGLATAVCASGDSPPSWWRDVDDRYGLLTLSSSNRIRWLPPRRSHGIVWHFAAETDPEP